WTMVCDSVSLCLSKGLGAPVGSLVGGSREFVEAAVRVRKRLGGWMRQSGHLAAAALIALEENVARLAEDHALAKQLAEGFHALAGAACEPARVETNIVLVEVRHPELGAADVARRLGDYGVKVMPFGPRHLRFVTHLDVGPDDVERALRSAEAILGGA
ncbi:MAG TPA: beta-eliminating lyase-related protein, partial [Planctomycetota bacterium]|nr:beta-eliminating lyase-related protein [Planctomycetota bacterium]